jgi:hypothetical protein
MDPKPHITHTFDHKANMYNKPMANTTARIGVPCYTMQLLLYKFKCTRKHMSRVQYGGVQV